jgi:hypothetical protein
VTVDPSTGQLGTLTSSRRFKTRIHSLGSMADRLMALRPVSFYCKPRYAKAAPGRQYGLIAEEVAKVFPDLVVRDSSGKPYSVAYQELPALLLDQAQRERRAAIRATKRADRAQTRADRQQSRDDRQQRQIDSLARQVRALASRG